LWEALFPGYGFTVPEPVDPWQTEAVAVIPCRAFAWSPQGMTAVGEGGCDGPRGQAIYQLWLWDLDGRRPLILGKANARRPVPWLAYSPDGKHIAVCHNDQLLSFFDLTETKVTTPQHLDTDIKGAIQTVAYAPDGKSLAAWGIALEVGSRLQLWDTSVYPPKVRFSADLPAFRSNEGMRVVFAQDNKTLILSTTGLVRLARIEGERLIVQEPPAGIQGKVLCWSTDLTHLAVAREDKSVVMYEKVGDSWKEARRLVGHGRDGALTGGFSPDKRFLLTCERVSDFHANRTLIWDVNGSIKCDWSVSTTFFEFAPDNQHLVARHGTNSPCIIYRVPK
jgi:WD40 repeat protein